MLKSLIRRLLPHTAADTAVLDDAYDRLHYLQNHHEWIDITLCRTGDSYQSLILALDPEQKELTVDDLYPNQPPVVLQPGDRLQINSRSRRAPVDFFTRVLTAETRDGETAYRLELPEEVGVRFSRGAFRVYVENEPSLDIDIHVDGAALPAVRIINLSTDGIKLWLPVEAGASLGQHRVLEDIVIKLPGGDYVDGVVELRNRYTINTPHPHVLAGGKLTIDNPQQRIRLQQYLASVQRKQRRRQQREPL